MKYTRFLQSSALAFASVGLLVPGSLVHAAESALPTAPTSEVQVPAILDVALEDGGVLRGQIVDRQGVALTHANVDVLLQGQKIATTRSDAEGYFTISGLRGGLYTVLAGDQGGVYRLWAPGSAPPAAQPGILMVGGGQLQRGQSGGNGLFSPGGLLMLSAVGGIVTAGVITSERESGS